MFPNNNSNMPKNNNISNKPPNISSGNIQDLPHRPKQMKNPRDMGMPSSYNYDGPEVGLGLRGGPGHNQNVNHSGAPFREDFNPRMVPSSNEPFNDGPPSFEGPPIHNQRFRDDRGPGVPLYSSPRSGERDFLQGGNLVGPGQLNNINGQEGNPGRGDPSGRVKPRYDPIGPFPGFGEPDNDHMGKPGPRGFGPGGMM